MLISESTGNNTTCVWEQDIVFLQEEIGAVAAETGRASSISSRCSVGLVFFSTQETQSQSV